MRVLVTGANGFVGSGLCRVLESSGHQVLALVREGANTELITPRVDILFGDFTRRASMRELLTAHQPDAIVHAASIVSNGRPDLESSIRINVTGTAVLAEEARRGGVLRWIQISSMSAHADNRSIYGGTKFLQEAVVRENAPPWTILRPSLVYGATRRGIFHRMTRLLDRLPVVPMVGFGNEPMRPIHVEDLAQAVDSALGHRASVSQTYDIGGPEDWTFLQMVLAMRRMLGRNRVVLPVPLPVCRLLALAMESVLPNPPITSDNVEGITRARRPDIEPARRDLDHAPRPFEEGFRECLEKGLLAPGP